MFIAGVVVGVIGGVIAHDNYSRYSKYRDHSNYSDAGKITSLKGKVERLKKIEREANRLKREVDEQYKDGIAVLEEEKLLQNGISELKRGNFGISKPVMAKNLLQNELKEKIEAELVADKKELEDLDAMIMKINQLQLK